MTSDSESEIPEVRTSSFSEMFSDPRSTSNQPTFRKDSNWVRHGSEDLISDAENTGFIRRSRPSSSSTKDEGDWIVDMESRHKTRMLDRSRPFCQSSGVWNIKRRIGYSDWSSLYSLDFFHTLVHLSTIKLLLITLITYVILIFLFALPYWLIDINYPTCNMDTNTLFEAYFFSMESMSSIGYGTKDYFFGECYRLSNINSFQF